MRLALITGTCLLTLAFPALAAQGHHDAYVKKDSPGVFFHDPCNRIGDQEAKRGVAICRSDVADFSRAPVGAKVIVIIQSKNGLEDVWLTQETPKLEDSDVPFLTVPLNIAMKIINAFLPGQSEEQALSKGDGDKPLIAGVAEDELNGTVLTVSQSSASLRVPVKSPFRWELSLYQVDSAESSMLIGTYPGPCGNTKITDGEIIIPEGRARTGNYRLILREYDVDPAPCNERLSEKPLITESAIPFTVEPDPARPPEHADIGSVSNMPERDRLAVAVLLSSQSQQWNLEAYQILTDLLTDSDDETIKNEARAAINELQIGPRQPVKAVPELASGG
ncbi:hypothetical protein ABI_22970 [Asticcacaulis biprosthecium C19]|uniref:HEAT repeat domain-containing protein n=1 Tax=Asticcacaulis biprosthecium C19 TaxID=715226 RepID=F4QNH7_9CAUL|nr:hypothetical protein [Asticcacaulis biprosthecium]EGF90885.1 hypothetical protein ABI_22970 [Asticcacaulis biprosthecium C19]